MEQSLKKYLSLIRKRLQKEKISSHYITEFLDNYEEQLYVMLEEIKAKNEALDEKEAEKILLERCAPVEHLVNQVVRAFTEEKEDDVSTTPSGKFHFFINKRVEWYKKKVLSTDVGLLLSVIVFWAILSLYHPFMVFNLWLITTLPEESFLKDIFYSLTGILWNPLVFLWFSYIVFGLIEFYINYKDLPLNKIVSISILNSWGISVMLVWQQMLVSLISIYEDYNRVYSQRPNPLPDVIDRFFELFNYNSYSRSFTE